MENDFEFRQNLSQSQQQTFRLSQRQIQAVRLLRMGSKDLRSEIYRNLSENPALEITSDIKNNAINSFSQRSKDLEKYSTSYSNSQKADAFQQILESKESRGETLQQHLISQLNLLNLSTDEYDLSKALIYNLDKNGCYGSMLSPKALLDKKRPLQNERLIEKCINRIQHMDPVGICCKTLEESLFVQAKIDGNASELTLFILNGHLDLLNPPVPEKIIKKLSQFKNDYHKKKFSGEIALDKINVTIEEVESSVKYILKLNPHPASEFVFDTNNEDFEKPDIVLKIKRKPGSVKEDNYAKGLVFDGSDFHFEVTLNNDDIPEVGISKDFQKKYQSKEFEKYRIECIDNAKSFIGNLAYRQSTIVLLGCAIVNAQKDFFEKGIGNINPLTRRDIAEVLDISESTVSRMTSKKDSRYFETDFGLFPASYFFSSRISSEVGRDVSAESIKKSISDILANESGNISDLKLAEILNEKGIKISRRTVTKYRNQLNITNSYNRNK
jgi:RNA polymerase sigma-54 factor